MYSLLNINIYKKKKYIYILKLIIQKYILNIYYILYILYFNIIYFYF